MKERPILFSGPMVRAILAGTKTQTRRPIKPQPVVIPDWSEPGVAGLRFIHRTGERTVAEHWIGESTHQGLRELCPHGVAGDQLWCRETWDAKMVDCRSCGGTGETYHPMDGTFSGRCGSCDASGKAFASAYALVYRADQDAKPYYQWRPSIHMPKWVSRLTLEVTDVRVQRVQDISEADARAEGCISDMEALRNLNHIRGADAVRAVPSRLRSARDEFADVWRGIYGAESWERNDWTWAVSFRVVDAENRGAA